MNRVDLEIRNIFQAATGGGEEFSITIPLRSRAIITNISGLLIAGTDNISFELQLDGTPILGTTRFTDGLNENVGPFPMPLCWNAGQVVTLAFSEFYGGDFMSVVCFGYWLTNAEQD